MSGKEEVSGELFSPDDSWQVRLVKMRDLFSDEVPEQVLHSNSPNPNFKVRKNWWAGVFSLFENSIDYREVDDSLGIELKQFIDEFRRNGFFGYPDRLTTVEDIQRANAMINRVLGEDSPEPKP